VLIPVIIVAYLLWMVRRTVMTQPEVAAKHHDIGTVQTVTLIVYFIPLLATLIVPWLLLGVTDPLAESLVRMLPQR